MLKLGFGGKIEKSEQRCFNCQKQKDLAKAYKNMKVCGYHTKKDHYHNECHSSTSTKYAHSGGSYKTKDPKYQHTNIQSSLRIEQ